MMAQMQKLKRETDKKEVGWSAALLEAARERCQVQWNMCVDREEKRKMKIMLLNEQVVHICFSFLVLCLGGFL